MVTFAPSVLKAIPTFNPIPNPTPNPTPDPIPNPSVLMSSPTLPCIKASLAGAAAVVVVRAVAA